MVGALGVDEDFVDPGVRVDVQDALPGLARVGGLVQPTIAAGAPQRPLSRDEDGVGIAGIEVDVRDVAGGLEADVLPGLAAVDGPVDAVAPRYAALVVVLAGADPHHVRVVRVKADHADRVALLAVEQWLVGDAVVVGHPQAAGRGADEVTVRSGGIDGEVRDTSRRIRRADQSKLHACKWVLGLLLVLLGRACRHRR